MRERKKQRTRDQIAATTLQLATAEGLDALTLDEIATGADISSRTFSNYFSCKEDALVDTLR